MGWADDTDDMDGYGDYDAGYGGGTYDAGAASEAQSGENDSQGSDGGFWGGGGSDPVDAANDAIAELGLGPAGFADYAYGNFPGGYGDQQGGRSTGPGFDYDSYYSGLAKAEFGAGNYLTAAKLALASIIDDVFASSLGKVGGVLGGSFGSSVVGILGVTNPYVAAGLVVAGYLAGTKGLSSLGQTIGDDLQRNLDDGVVTPGQIDDLINSVGEGVAGDLFEFLDNASAEDVQAMIAEGQEYIESNKSSGLARRRTNIIGTGRSGLTIE